MASTMPSTSPREARAAHNFKSAVLHLKSVLPTETCTRLGEITFPDFDQIDNVHERAEALEAALEELIQARANLSKKGGWGKKIEDLMLTWFQASYPFATLFLTVAKEGSSVRQYK